MSPLSEPPAGGNRPAGVTGRAAVDAAGLAAYLVVRAEFLHRSLDIALRAGDDERVRRWVGLGRSYARVVRDKGLGEPLAEVLDLGRYADAQAARVKAAADARAAFDRAVRGGFSNITWARQDPDLLRLRDDPKLKARWDKLTTTAVRATSAAVGVRPGVFQFSIEVANDSPFPLLDVKIVCFADVPNANGKVGAVQYTTTAASIPAGGSHVWVGVTDAPPGRVTNARVEVTGANIGRARVKVEPGKVELRYPRFGCW